MSKRYRKKPVEVDAELWTSDYIIKGVKGEFYACKPDIFNLTYEDA